jgi:hypothetical protein
MKTRRLNKHDYHTILFALAVQRRQLEKDGNTHWVTYRQVIELSELFMDKADIDNDERDLYQ